MLQNTLCMTHILKLLDKAYKYEMDPIRTVSTTEWTRDTWQKDGGMDRRTNGRSEPKIPPTTMLCVGYKKIYLRIDKFDRKIIVKSWLM